jgi:cyclohexyl-isocyanide hydratase
MKFYFVVFDGVEELDLVVAWELVCLLSDQGLCELQKLITLNEMMLSGEHRMRHCR